MANTEQSPGGCRWCSSAAKLWEAAGQWLGGEHEASLGRFHLGGGCERRALGVIQNVPRWRFGSKFSDVDVDVELPSV